ncbi:WG repeat-containing protein [Algoriphagus formosus]|uniref:WG repeat-containing protein n=1 Tax=Algoriphagus formosus TaxID=2007308 RepID=UPI000C286866|nr:WG repeat-containing protein [Algoriphagus formosus]
MKKLVNMLLLGMLCLPVIAQIQLEGKFDVDIPQNQIWDGRYLLYTFRGDAHIYDVETEEKWVIPDHQVSGLGYQDGYYFQKKDDLYTLRKVGEEEPVLPYRFSWVSGWFGNTVLGWEEVTGPEAGIYGVWYQMGEGILARHELKDIHQAVGFDYTQKWFMRELDWQTAQKLYSYQYQEGLIVLPNKDKETFSFYDLELKQAFPGEFIKAEPFSEGLAAVQNEDGLWGFIDRNGQVKVPFIYRRKPGQFHSGRVKVINSQNLVGYIDTKGELEIPAKFSSATDFYKGKAIAKPSGWDKPRVVLDLDGREEKLFCINCVLHTRTYKSYAAYFPSQDIMNWVDEEHLIMGIWGQASLYTKEGEKVFDRVYPLLKDLVDGKLILVEGAFLAKDLDQRFYLWDLESDRALIELSFTEF